MEPDALATPPVERESPESRPVGKKRDGLLRRIASGFGVRVAATACGFLLNVILGRFLGPVGNGYFALAQSAAVLGATVGKFGLDNSVVRFIARAEIEGKPNQSRKVLSAALSIATIGCLITSSWMFFGSGWIAVVFLQDPELEHLVRIVSIATLPYALSTLIGQALVGLKRTADGIAVSLLAIPLVGCIGSLLLVPTVGIQGAVYAYVASAIFALVWGCTRWMQLRPRGEVGEAISAKELLRSCLPLWAMAIIQFLLVWSPTFLLQIWATTADVGIYNVAARTAFLLTFVLGAVNAGVSPVFSEMFAKGNYDGLGRIARRSSQAMAVVAFVPLMLFLVAPGWVMSLYGPGFEVGGLTLAIMAIGQFVNVVTGPVQQLLMMTGREIWIGALFFGMVPIQAALMVWLIPIYGALGAGLATAVVMVLQNLVCAYLVKRALGIWTLPSPREIRSVPQDVVRLLHRRGHNALEEA